MSAVPEPLREALAECVSFFENIDEGADSFNPPTAKWCADLAEKCRAAIAAQQRAETPPEPTRKCNHWPGQKFCEVCGKGFPTDGWQAGFEAGRMLVTPPERAETPPHCPRHDLPQTRNPHPKAGDPSLEFGYEYQCIPCLVMSRRNWSERCHGAEKRIAEMERERAETPQASPEPSVCSDNDSPWLICKTCKANGQCARAFADKLVVALARTAGDLHKACEHVFAAQAKGAPQSLDDQLYAAYSDGRADERDEIRDMVREVWAEFADTEHTQAAGICSRILTTLDKRK